MTKLRQEEGKAFCGRVITELQALNIPSAQFEIAFNDYSEADVDKYISNNMDKLEVDLSDDKHYRRRILDHIHPRELEGYLYDEGVMLKKAKDSSIRSSKYTKAIFYILSDELYITRRTISIISTDKENETVEIPYETLSGVEIIRQRGTKRDGKKEFLVKETFIKISYGEGESFVTPIHDDITADEFAELILKQVKAYKDGKEAIAPAE